jgi:glycosyltransferase involved in cell wall biosynthesis
MSNRSQAGIQKNFGLIFRHIWRKIVSSGLRRRDVLCFGGGDWWYHNRAHLDMQLMRRFAQKTTVLYVNSVVVQKPLLNKKSDFVKKFIRKAKSIMKGLKQSGEGFWVYSPFTLPVHHISVARSLNELLLRAQVNNIIRKLEIRDPIIWVTCPGACDTSIRLKRSKLIFQRTDRWEEFPNVDSDTIKRYDRKLKANADITIFVSSLLYEEERNECRKAFYLDHGVDYEMFAYAHENGKIPQDIANIRKPIVGFFGGIDDHTSDIHFIENVIDLLPEVSFVFVGKASVDCRGLLARRNVWMLGQKPYRQITHYVKCFDVTIMPWRQNRWIEACNPVKLKEYLALGKPIVSTPFAELQKYQDVVYEAKGPKEFAECIKKGLAENNAEWVAARRDKVKHASWESKAELILEELFGQASE